MSTTRDERYDQPLPVGNGEPVIHELVIADLRERLRIGTEKYGVGLQAFNGRNPAQDAYEEDLDRTVYLKQLALEWEALNRKHAEAAALLQKALTAIAETDGDMAMEGLEMDGRLNGVGAEIAAWLDATQDA